MAIMQYEEIRAFYTRIEQLEREVAKHERQLDRVIDLISEFDLTPPQRQALVRAYRGSEDAEGLL